MNSSACSTCMRSCSGMLVRHHTCATQAWQLATHHEVKFRPKLQPAKTCTQSEHLSKAKQDAKLLVQMDRGCGQKPANALRNKHAQTTAVMLQTVREVLRGVSERQQHTTTYLYFRVASSTERVSAVRTCMAHSCFRQFCGSRTSRTSLLPSAISTARLFVVPAVPSSP